MNDKIKDAIEVVKTVKKELDRVTIGKDNCFYYKKTLFYTLWDLISILIYRGIIEFKDVMHIAKYAEELEGLEKLKDYNEDVESPKQKLKSLCKYTDYILEELEKSIVRRSDKELIEIFIDAFSEAETLTPTMLLSGYRLFQSCWRYKGDNFSDFPDLVHLLHTKEEINNIEKERILKLIESDDSPFFFRINVSDDSKMAKNERMYYLKMIQEGINFFDGK